MKKVITLFVFALALVLVACNAGGSNDPMGGDEAACPTPGDDTQLYTDETHGYCVLYPAMHQPIDVNEAETVFVVGDLMDVSNPRISINVTDAAGQDTEAAAGQILSVFGLSDMSTQSNVIMSGVDAIVLDNMPGQDINRRVIVVYNGRLYDLTFSPVGADYGDLTQQTEQVYRTVVDSFTFLP